MECEEFLTDYSDFLDRQFEEHPIVSYCDHLLRCSECAEYDRVMRRGLKLVKGLEPPAVLPGLAPRVSERVLAAGQYRGRGQERGRTVMVAAAATLALGIVASMATLDSGRTATLPPLVVEPTAAEELPSLWGPAPKFTTAVSFLSVPDLNESRLVGRPPERLSLFRAPLKGSRRPLIDGAQKAQE